MLILINFFQCSNLESEDNYHHRHSGDANFNSLTLSLQSCELSCPTRHSLHTAETVVKSTRHDRWEDPAEVDSCESCSMHGSNEGSEGKVSIGSLRSITSFILVVFFLRFLFLQSTIKFLLQ